MINFYKANKKVTGTACSFYLNKRDNAFFSTMIKQDSWDEGKRVGSFSKNRKNPLKTVHIKYSPKEIAGFVDTIESNRKLTGYHGSNQVVKFNFAPYMRDGEQIGFSYGVIKESKEDSTEKANFIIGFDWVEARLLKEYLLKILADHFEIEDNKYDFMEKKSPPQKVKETEESGLDKEEDDMDIW